MNLTRVVAAAVVCGALATAGVTAASAEVAGGDVSMMSWRVVGGPWPNTHAGSNQCIIEREVYKFRTGNPKAGCLLDADGNQWFLWADE